jgi:nucleotide-binding universal stress UspA family protein
MITRVKSFKPARLHRKIAVKSTREEKRPELQLKSILVPVDFSKYAGKSLNFAASIAKQLGSRISLLTVLEPHGIFHGKRARPAESEKEPRECLKRNLNQFATDNIDELIPFDYDVRVGNVYQEICEAARAKKADLVVINTHGRSMIKELLLGSTAQHVVRSAPCSVLVVRRDGESCETFRPNKILVPIDFSPGSRNALADALVLAKRFQARVQLLYVVPIYFVTAELEYYGHLEAELKAYGTRQIALLAKFCASKGVQVETALRYGRVGTAICDAVKEFDCDLLVIASRGHSQISCMLLGSTTEDVVRHANCPVFVVREKRN